MPLSEADTCRKFIIPKLNLKGALCTVIQIFGGNGPIPASKAANLLYFRLKTTRSLTATSGSVLLRSYGYWKKTTLFTDPMEANASPMQPSSL